jgi:hypothetical protein
MDGYDLAIAHLATDLDKALSGSPAQFREWYVKEIILADEARSLLPHLDPAPLVQSAIGHASSTEHAAIAAKLLFEVSPGDLLTMPNPYRPEDWENVDRITHLILLAFTPWNTIRYDPESENAFHLSRSGHWVSHGKGKPSDNALLRVVEAILVQLRPLSVFLLMGSRSYQEITEIIPPEDATKEAALLQASNRAFHKYLNSKTTARAVAEHLTRCPIMFFDTSTMNTVTGFIPVGSGVIPTEDVIYNGMFGIQATVKTGMQIPADPEFVISSAAGVRWPNNAKYEEFMQMRADIVDKETDYTHEEWVEASRIVRNSILQNHCPTYHAFLKHAFPTSEQQPPEEADAFLRLLAAAVFGRKLKVVAALIGAPNAGKDTVISWLSYLLGEQVAVLPVSSLTAQGDDDRGFAPLKGARVAVTSGELGEGRGASLYADKLKTVTSGGGLLRVAEKYEKPTTIFFDGMLVIQGNSVPTIIGGDKALFENRLVAIEFKHPFPLTSQSFEAKYRAEAGHFMQVLFLAFLEYETKGGGMAGIDPPDEWRVFSKRVADSANPYAPIEQAITHDPDLDIPVPQFYAALTLLVQRTLDRDTKMNPTRWQKRLAVLGFDTKDGGKHRDYINRNGYKGRVYHLTVNADRADGFFTQEDWTAALQDARAASRA